MARTGGNPDFGVKFRFDYGRKEPLTEQVKAVVYPYVKEKLKLIATERNCTVPDLIREALDEYISKIR